MEFGHDVDCQVQAEDVLHGAHPGAHTPLGTAGPTTLTQEHHPPDDSRGAQCTRSSRALAPTLVAGYYSEFISPCPTTAAGRPQTAETGRAQNTKLH